MTGRGTGECKLYDLEGGRFLWLPLPHSVILSCFSSYDRLQLLLFFLRIVHEKGM